MIDVSDGLLLDLGRLADASGVGFALEDVPVWRPVPPSRTPWGAATTTSS